MNVKEIIADFHELQVHGTKPLHMDESGVAVLIDHIEKFHAARKMHAGRANSQMDRIEKLEAKLNPPFLHDGNCEGPALDVTCLNCEQAKFERWFAENDALQAIVDKGWRPEAAAWLRRASEYRTLDRRDTLRWAAVQLAAEAAKVKP